MIDFHSHILHCIDDGASSLSESLKIADSLISQGVDTVVATPHYYYENVSIRDFLQIRKARVDELRAALKGKNLNIVAGAEVYLSSGFTLADLELLAIEGTKYVAIELPFIREFDKNVFAHINGIVDYAGLTPIIVHAERYPAIIADPYILKILIAQGCIIQINTSSLVSPQCKRLALAMLTKNQAHILGTDSHNMTTRPPIYKDIIAKITARCGKEKFDAMQANMRDILTSGAVVNKDIYPIKKFLGFYF